MQLSIAYLACPYHHEDRAVKAQRLKIVTAVAAWFHLKRYYVYSPLTHNSPLAEHGVHGTWDAWCHFDLEMLKRCDKLLVLTLPGWEISKGVQAEIAYAKELEIPVEFVPYCMQTQTVSYSLTH